MMPDLTLPLGLTLSMTPGPDHLWLNVAEMRRTNTLLQGFTRAGKSYLVRWLCEQLFSEMPQIIFDVEGEYVSLTEKFDYALFSADTPVKPGPEAAPLLVRRLLEMGTPAIFDLSEMASAEQQRFTALACAELVRASPRTPRSVLVVLDEVQRLAPQAGQGEAASTQAIRDLANRGLKRGISLLAATQRHSSVDAGLRGAMANLVVGGTPPGLDMETAGKKLGFNTQQQRRLASLKRGEFFFLGPAFGDPAAARQVYLATSGKVETHHLDAGEARTYTPPPASEAVAALYAQLGELTPEDASARGDLSVRAKNVSAEVKDVSAEAQEVKALQAHNGSLTTRIAALEAEVRQLRASERPAPVRASERPEPAKAVVAVHEALAGPAASPQPAARVSVPEPVSAKTASAPVPSSGLVRRLGQLLGEFDPYPLTLAQMEALTREAWPAAQAQTLVRALRRQNLATWDGSHLSAAGTGSWPAHFPLMDAAGFRRRWGQALGQTALRLLSALEAAGPDGVTWAEWLDRAAYSPGGGRTWSVKPRLLELGFAVQDGDRYRLGPDWPREETAAGMKPLLRLEGGATSA